MSEIAISRRNYTVTDVILPQVSLIESSGSAGRFGLLCLESVLEELFMTVEAEPKSRIGFWPLMVCLFFNLPLLLVAVAEIFGTLVPAKAESMDIFQFIAKVLFFCFLFGIPLAVVSALCSGLYLFFRFRRLSSDFRLYFACSCILPIVLIYIAAGVLSGLSR